MDNLNCAMIYQALPGGPLRLTQAVQAWDDEDAARSLVAGDTAADVLEALFAAGNMRRDLLPKLAHSVSVGDVIALVDNDGVVAHYLCSPVGWTQVRGIERYDADHKPVLRTVAF